MPIPVAASGLVLAEGSRDVRAGHGESLRTFAPSPARLASPLGTSGRLCGWLWLRARTLRADQVNRCAWEEPTKAQRDRAAGAGASPSISVYIPPSSAASARGRARSDH